MRRPQRRGVARLKDDGTALQRDPAAAGRVAGGGGGGALRPDSSMAASSFPQPWRGVKRREQLRQRLFLATVVGLGRGLLDVAADLGPSTLAHFVLWHAAGSTNSDNIWVVSRVWTLYSDDRWHGTTDDAGVFQMLPGCPSSPHGAPDARLARPAQRNAAYRRAGMIPRACHTVS